MNTRIMSSWSSLLLLLLLVEGQQQLANAIEVEECQSPADFFRLPRLFQPTSYLPHLWLTPGKENYRGTVHILLDIQEHMDTVDFLKSRTISGNLSPYALDRKNIILNAHGLTVEDVKFDQNRRSSRPTSVCHDAQHGILVITLKTVPIPGEPATLYIKFSGEAKSEAMGLRTSVTEGTNKMISSHFKPAYARRAFPCFDDPEFKASVDLTINHPPGSIALSNVEVRRFKDNPSLKTTFFKKTPNIPIYQLSIVVGELHSVYDNTDFRYTMIGIHTYKYLRNDAQDMLNKAKLAYDRASNFFPNPPISLMKLDIVVLNWESTEVENFGLITMSLDSMKGNEQKANLHDSNSAITVLLRAMTHQWLSCVRMGWWNDLWLKEGVVAYLANEISAQFYPGIASYLNTLVDGTISTMDDDDHPAKSHRIMDDEKLKRTEEFVASFNWFAHKKSAAIVRMFAGFFGKDNFNSAIRGLIQSGAGRQPVEIDELWERLLSYAPEHGNMKEVARKWALNRGYPTLYLTLQSDRTVTVSQLQDLAGGQEWPVPIKYEQHTAALRTDTRAFVLASVEETFELAEPFNINDENQWLTFNHKSQGYYRVVYQPNMLLIARGRAISSNQVPPADRLHLLSDSYSHLKRTDEIFVFELILQFFERETDDGVMLLLVEMLSSISLSLDSIKLVKKIMMHYYKKNGGVSEPCNLDLMKCYVRGRVVNYLVNRLQHQNVIEDLDEFRNLFQKFPPFMALSLDYLALMRLSMLED